MFGHRWGVGDRRRVLIPLALGSDEFLRVTWHEGRRLMVFSHWDGDQCTAATPVRVGALSELAALVVGAVADQVGVATTWPAPTAGDRVVEGPGPLRTA